MPVAIIQNTEAEKHVIGSMLLDSGVCVDMLSRLKPEHFTSQVYRDMFTTAGKLVSASMPVDIVTLPEGGAGKFNNSDVMELVDVTSAANVDYHAGILVDKYFRREVVTIANGLLEQVNGTEDILSTVQEAQTLLSTIGEDRSYDANPGTMIDGVVETIQRIVDEEIEKEFSIPSLPWLDQILGGLYPGKVYYVAGRPSEGKSALALQICKNAATSGHRVYMSSLEMMRMEVGKRLLSEESGVPLLPTFMHGVKPNSTQLRRILRAGDKIGESSLQIDDRRGMGTMSYRSILQRAKIEGDPIQVLCIDYLTLLEMNKGDNQNLRMASTVRELQVLAGQYNVALVIVSQLSRESEKRAGNVPKLSDLRDSGANEQVADAVIFVYKDPASQQEKSERKLDTIVDVQKNRGGDLGAIQTTFDKPIQRFTLREVA